MSFKMVFLPPQSDTTRGWADRLNRDVQAADVIIAETVEQSKREIADCLIPESSTFLSQPR